jgi:hypothetical protein
MGASTLTIAVILILGILWVAVLVPPIMRARGNQGHGGSVSDFTHRLTSLGRVNGHRDRRSTRRTSNRPLYVPTATTYSVGGGMSAQQKRRRDVLVVLGGVVGVTLLLALVTRSPLFIFLQLVADVALGAYVYLLLQYKQRAQERGAKVSYLGAAEYGAPTTPFSTFSDGAGQSASMRIVPLRQTASR